MDAGLKISGTTNRHSCEITYCVVYRYTQAVSMMIRILTLLSLSHSYLQNHLSLISVQFPFKQAPEEKIGVFLSIWITWVAKLPTQWRTPQQSCEVSYRKVLLFPYSLANPAVSCEECARYPIQCEKKHTFLEGMLWCVAMSWPQRVCDTYKYCIWRREKD
jgi:hypothetical protein